MGLWCRARVSPLARHRLRVVMANTHFMSSHTPGTARWCRNSMGTTQLISQRSPEAEKLNACDKMAVKLGGSVARHLQEAEEGVERRHIHTPASPHFCNCPPCKREASPKEPFHSSTTTCHQVKQPTSRTSGMKNMELKFLLPIAPIIAFERGVAREGSCT